MKETVFVITILCEILLAGSLILTLTVPRIQVWPPPGKDSWQYRFTWTTTILSVLGIIVLGSLDWNSFIFDDWIRFVIGGFFMVGGLTFALWGVRTLSVHTSLGLGGELIESRPYRYSRNPQYAGDIAALFGYALICNSGLSLVAAAIGIIWFILAPFTEEPWLRKQFGVRFDEYATRVPRFISWRSFKRAQAG